MSGPPGLSGEIPGAGVDVDGAVAPRVGRDRGARPRPRRHGPGGAGDGYFDLHDRSRAERTAIARAGAVGPRAAPGWGRKRTVDKGSTLLRDLEGLVEPTTSGVPHSPLRWTAKSTRTLARTLQSMGHRISHQLVRELLSAAGYSLQANRKTREGPPHPDRDAQFRHITAQVRQCQAAGQPVISVDTKKKELVGDFKNAGRTWRPPGQPETVRVHDFLIPAQGKVVPYGVYDLTRNAGWVSVGIDHDTASFAVRTIGRWWQKMGRPRYRGARSLLITADAGGSNGARLRLWKWELQQLANRTGLTIRTRHFH